MGGGNDELGSAPTAAKGAGLDCGSFTAAQGTQLGETVESNVQSSVKTYLPGFGNGWLKYCAMVQFLNGQRNTLRVIF